MRPSPFGEFHRVRYFPTLQRLDSWPSRLIRDRLPLKDGLGHYCQRAKSIDVEWGLQLTRRILTAARSLLSLEIPAGNKPVRLFLISYRRNPRRSVQTWQLRKKGGPPPLELRGRLPLFYKRPEPGHIPSSRPERGRLTSGADRFREL